MWIKFYKSLLYTNPYPQNNLILGPNTNINEQKKKERYKYLHLCVCFLLTRKAVIFDCPRFCACICLCP